MNNTEIKNQIEAYNIRYKSQCKNAGESMPLGGHDVGCNVWTQDNIVYLYMAQSGTFDEAGNMVKAGRIKIEFDKSPFKDSYSQELRLYTGDILIEGMSDGVRTQILLWTDIKYGSTHIQIDSEVDHEITVSYENWRNLAGGFSNGRFIFTHLNMGETHFDRMVAEEELEPIKDKFPDVQKNLVYGGCLFAEGINFIGSEESSYENLPCISHKMALKGKSLEICTVLHLSYAGDTDKWKTELIKKIEKILDEGSVSLKKESETWWKETWERSYIFIKKDSKDESDPVWQMGRNYQLFRYMLACNAYGSYPTKFNGGLFTIDPCVWGARFVARTPDERDWGGIVFTAQNQRLVYWPMLRSGDVAWMKPQFDFYFRLLEGAKARTKFFFDVDDAACIPEQTDANGLSAYYGLHGLDYPIHVRYHYVTSVEFSYMMLQYLEFTKDEDPAPYIEFIDTILNFYDKKYNKLDERGCRIIFPSTAQETYHKAGIVDVWGQEGRYAANYNEDETAAKNPADVIYALRAVIKTLLKDSLGSDEQRAKWKKLMDELPPIPFEYKNGHNVIAPCEEPKEYVKTNCEFPQLYCAYPYHEVGIGDTNNKDLKIARDTYFYGWDEEDQLMNLSWMYVGLLAARLGLTEEAMKYQLDKLKDSGRRFPAFWGPGHDYTPDHNHGGCGMIGLQEMLMQVIDDKIYMLPAWQKDIDVEFKLWIDKDKCVEASYTDGKLEKTVK